MQERILYLLRGLPGSGKSTLAAALSRPEGIILSTDAYFMEGGRYCFRPSFLGRAHRWNLQRSLAVMEAGLSPIVIDNTNIRLREALPYIRAAVSEGYKVEIREPDTPWKFDVDELSRRNRHHVSRENIARMMDRWQKSEHFQEAVRGQAESASGEKKEHE